MLRRSRLPLLRAAVPLIALVLVSGCRLLRPERGAAGPEPSDRPPSGLLPGEVPQFVCFGSDDNGYSGLAESGASGGLHFLTELFAGRRNPAGHGDAGTFDGAPVHYSFYVNTRYLAPGPEAGAYTGPREDPTLVRRAWREALAAGNEIGNHTHSHPHGRELTVAQWQAEMRRCAEILERPEGRADAPAPGGLGLRRGALAGFRTPYLEYGDGTLEAAQREAFAYDCSIEEGMEDDQDGRNFVWPYRLDRGSPASPEIRPHPGLWEIPVYVLVVPPDAECERLGVPPGLRERLKARQAYFDPRSGKITGMDWNLWCEFAMTPAEFLATVEYTLALRLAGNRCPLTIGLHSELYSDRPGEPGCPTPPAARRATLAELVDRLQRHDEVRIVSARELLQWLRHPASRRSPV
jgi:peptidoglycan/xylan/chitin deacetylase (PgdA/CDA1 family)